MGTRIDYTGKQRFELTAVSYTGRTHRGLAIWTFQCSCGNQKDIIAKIVFRDYKPVKSCGHLLNKKGKENPMWKGCGDISGEYWSSVRRGARTRNIEFSISVQDGWTVYERQNGLCALTGVPIRFGRRSEGTASLDRVDSSRGYTKDNIQWVHKKVNQLKWDLGLDEFVAWCFLVATKNEPTILGGLAHAIPLDELIA